MGKNDDNRADQLNPNNDSYWQSRDEDFRPDDWEEQIENEDRYEYSKDELDNHSNQMNPNNEK